MLLGSNNRNTEQRHQVEAFQF